MDGAKSGETILIDEKTIFLSDLPMYLDILGSDVRLRILKFAATSPKDIREISNEIETSLENTKRHLDKLMSIGIIKQEAG